MGFRGQTRERTWFGCAETAVRTWSVAGPQLGAHTGWIAVHHKSPIVNTQKEGHGYAIAASLSYAHSRVWLQLPLVL